jgi:hypothetical protein
MALTFNPVTSEQPYIQARLKYQGCVLGSSFHQLMCQLHKYLKAHLGFLIAYCPSYITKLGTNEYV